MRLSEQINQRYKDIEKLSLTENEGTITVGMKVGDFSMANNYKYNPDTFLDDVGSLYNELKKMNRSYAYNQNKAKENSGGEPSKPAIEL